MVRRLNPIALCVIIVLCILLIFASNRIPLSPFSSTPTDEYPHSVKLNSIHRYNQYHYQVHPNINSYNSLDNNNRRSAKYNRFMHPHNTEQRSQYYNRKFGNTLNNLDSATAETTNFYNITVRIEDVIDAQRQRIAQKMKDFEYTEQMIGLSALTPETNGQPVQSGNYYHYEPLLNYEIIQIRKPPESDTAISTLKQLLKCNYTTLTDYLDYGQSHNYLFSHNVRLWRKCNLYPQFCYDPNFLNPFCRLFPFQSMKVVRLRAELAEPLLIDPALNVKIVLLVRDPRGTIQSRKHRDWCPGQPDCDNAAVLCKDMLSDYIAAEMFIKKYPNKFKAIRYEDLSLDPFKQTKEILTFYGLPFDADVEEFLDSHTRTDIGGVSSTFRDSKTAPFHWMRDLGFDEINRIQSDCKEAMLKWGYKAAEDEDTLLKNIFNPLLKFPFATSNESNTQ